MAIESKMNRGPIGRPLPSGEKKRLGVWGWAIVPLLVILVGGVWYTVSLGDSPTTEVEESPGVISIGSGEYQAVFLDNDQVYFGKLERARGNFYELTDVFYLQSGTAIDQASNLSLTKLGNEAHGPEDRMQINGEHILFIEDMKNDSKVVQAIQSYKSNTNE